MNFKETLLTYLIIIAIGLAGAAAGGYGGYQRGARETVQRIAACTIEDAHADKCSIPCAEDADCRAKNGRGDH